MTEHSSDVFCLQSGSQQQQDCQIEQLWFLTQKASWTLSLIDPKMARCNDEEVGPVFWFHYSGLHLHSICLLITQFISLAFELKQWALPSNDSSDHSSSNNKKTCTLMSKLESDFVEWVRPCFGDPVLLFKRWDSYWWLKQMKPGR